MPHLIEGALLGHLSLITFNAKSGSFEINWSVQSHAFNNAMENFLLCRAALNQCRL